MRNNALVNYVLAQGNEAEKQLDSILRKFGLKVEYYKNRRGKLPVKVVKGTGSRPYKIVEKATNRVVGTSTNRKDAEVSAWKRNTAHKEKKG